MKHDHGNVVKIGHALYFILLVKVQFWHPGSNISNRAARFFTVKFVVKLVVLNPLSPAECSKIGA